MSALAEEAGVQRATVYRYFPDEVSLFAACTAHYWARNPLPSHRVVEGDQGPRRATAPGLAEFYDFFSQNEAMLEKSGRDAHMVPAMSAAREAFGAFLEDAARRPDDRPPGARGARRRTSAAVSHALHFTTWQSLTRMQGLSNAEAVAVMAAMVEGAGSARAPRPAHA